MRVTQVNAKHGSEEVTSTITHNQETKVSSLLRSKKVAIKKQKQVPTITSSQQKIEQD